MFRVVEVFYLLLYLFIFEVVARFVFMYWQWFLLKLRACSPPARGPAVLDAVEDDVPQGYIPWPHFG